MTKPEIEVSVRVTDGSFQASLRVPVSAGSKYFDDAAKTWLDMMRQAVALALGDPQRSQAPEPSTEAVSQPLKSGEEVRGD